MQPTPLLGREQEVAAACVLLLHPDVRLLTFTGTAGVGKTRLAVQVATALVDQFAYGACFVPLAPITEAQFVLPTLARCLGVTETGQLPLAAHLTAYLQDKQLLFLLDNFEQVIAATSVVTNVLEACPQVKIIVTSREVLHLRAEHQFPVFPLALPDLAHLNAETLQRAAAGALFLQRVQAIKPGFQVTTTNARAIAEICHRLDGLPLALELAAARITVLSPQALLALLEHRFEILTGGARDLPERQQTLRSTIAWSYDLLDASEQQLFRRLSIFVGGCTLHAAEALCAGLDEGSEAKQLLDTVTSLTNKSLLYLTDKEGEEPRIKMLETLREFGLDDLRARGTLAQCRRAHASCVVALAEEAETHLKRAQQGKWLRRLEAEQGNIRAALSWCIEQQEADLALRLAGALWRFWFMRGFYSEGYQWLETALNLPQAGERTAARAKALCGAGWLSSFHQGESGSTRLLLEESAALFRELGDQAGLAEALSELAEGIYRRNDTAAARALFEECVVLARAAEDPWLLSMSLRTLGWFLFEYEPGTVERAAHLLEESRALSRELGDTWGLARVLTTLTRVTLSQGHVAQAAALAQENLTTARELDSKTEVSEALFHLATATLFLGDEMKALTLLEESFAQAHEMGNTTTSKGIRARALLLMGRIALSQDQLGQATTLLEQSLALFRAVGFNDNISLALRALGEVKRVQGDLIQAMGLYQEGLVAARAIGYHIGIGRNLLGLARVAAEERHPYQATRLLAAAAFWVDPRREIDPFERAEHERTLEHVRARLGASAFAAAWAEGHTSTLDEVLAGPAPFSPGKPSSPARKTTLAYPNDLTEREVEVLRLVAQGLTNAQIAKHLVISTYTANNHVRSILSKLGVASRSGATRFALEHHLV